MNSSEYNAGEKIEPSIRKYETIKQLAKRHMLDQNHTTTDEELKNAIVELGNQILDEYTGAGTKSKNQGIR
jgi:hypothetical protein